MIIRSRLFYTAMEMMRFRSTRRQEQRLSTPVQGRGVPSAAAVCLEPAEQCSGLPRKHRPADDVNLPGGRRGGVHHRTLALKVAASGDARGQGRAGGLPTGRRGDAPGEGLDSVDKWDRDGDGGVSARREPSGRGGDGCGQQRPHLADGLHL